ncbi:MAG: Signal transduction histidine kinase [Mucilaginibacter sp.]|nr:Signal transduction histidine kinase [Mucilaginibacter sp.]
MLDKIIHMHEDKTEIYTAVITTSVIFMMVASGLIFLVIVYNNRKKKHIEEKIQLNLIFEAEIAKTQLEVQEQTMQTIGADLHDNIGQLLSLTSLTLNSIELADIAKAKQKIDASIDLTLRSIKEMRLLGKLLQGDQLIVLGLAEAIRYEISWLERSGKFVISYLQDDELPAAGNPDKDLILFRIVQEVLNNIIKHAGATQIGIKLGYAEGILQLSINDNGVGFDVDNLPVEQRGMGLQNIQKRAAIIGGEAAIISNPGAGTNITISIQYP